MNWSEFKGKNKLQKQRTKQFKPTFNQCMRDFFFCLVPVEFPDNGLNKVESPIRIQLFYVCLFTKQNKKRALQCDFELSCQIKKIHLFVRLLSDCRLPSLVVCFRCWWCGTSWNIQMSRPQPQQCHHHKLLHCKRFDAIQAWNVY